MCKQSASLTFVCDLCKTCFLRGKGFIQVKQFQSRRRQFSESRWKNLGEKKTAWLIAKYSSYTS